ncbi:MAG: hypothetical protein HKN12_07980, partial [Gemmatimonadetes bacterium]|nr:hypothetical protein [Gemmatimonadota bacterium]
MAAAAGKKVKRIAGNKAILDDSNGKAELQIPCDGNTLVTVKGTSVESAVMVAEKGVGWDALSQAVAQ